jgi:acyl-CoA dehydrogenase
MATDMATGRDQPFGLYPLGDTLQWPFFEDTHRQFAADLTLFADRRLLNPAHGDVDEACRAHVRGLGEAGFLRVTVPPGADLNARLDVRTLCLAREILAFRDGLADFSFAMQGLGSGPISLFGSPAQRQRYLPPVAAGERIAAFALSEQEAGSDVSALACRAVPDGNSHVLIDGEKTWISNGGIADHYVVFVRTGEAPGAKGLSAFIVDADTPGLRIKNRIEVTAPHPLATLSFESCRVPVEARLGGPGDGFRIAMATLDVFRSTVGAAALGFARRAQVEALQRATHRQLFGQPLGDLQLTQAALADNQAAIDAAALLIYRAAWTKDQGAARVTREAAMAKLVATDSAQWVVDRSLQLHGGLGVTVGTKIEELYREVRALRIYEGASEVQKLVIARDLLKAHAQMANGG